MISKPIRSQALLEECKTIITYDRVLEIKFLTLVFHHHFGITLLVG